jgi:peptide/nickel transport system permease protein
MFTYAIRRILQMIPMILASSVVVFTLQSLAPGDPTDEIRFNNPRVTEAQIQAIRHAQGLDQPIYIRYFKWLGRAVQGDFGPSRQNGVPAIDRVFKEALPKTLVLTGTAFLVSLLIAIPVGIFSATKQNTFWDRMISSVTFVGYSIPAFIMGIFLLYMFGVTIPNYTATHFAPAWQIAPFPPVTNVPYSKFSEVTEGAIGLGSYFKNWYLILVLPVMSLALREVASISRFMRASMLEVLGQDFVRTARAKGLNSRAVVWRHAFRNALIPIVTIVGLSIPGVMGGAIVTESIFSYHGMGLLTLESLVAKDYNLAMVAVLFLGLMIMVFNLITDMLYAVVDPRIRYN